MSRDPFSPRMSGRQSRTLDTIEAILEASSQRLRALLVRVVRAALVAPAEVSPAGAAPSGCCPGSSTS